MLGLLLRQLFTKDDIIFKKKNNLLLNSKISSIKNSKTHPLVRRLPSLQVGLVRLKPSIESKMQNNTYLVVLKNPCVKFKPKVRRCRLQN